jgi:hypothetical protein
MLYCYYISVILRFCLFLLKASAWTPISPGELCEQDNVTKDECSYCTEVERRKRQGGAAIKNLITRAVAVGVKLS